MKKSKKQEEGGIMHTIAETNKLLSCPFCGREATRRKDLNLYHCPDFDCMGNHSSDYFGYSSLEKAKEYWNKRDIKQ